MQVALPLREVLLDEGDPPPEVSQVVPLQAALQVLVDDVLNYRGLHGVHLEHDLLHAFVLLDDGVGQPFLVALLPPIVHGSHHLVAKAVLTRQLYLDLANATVELVAGVVQVSGGLATLEGFDHAEHELSDVSGILRSELRSRERDAVSYVVAQYHFVALPAPEIVSQVLHQPVLEGFKRHHLVLSHLNTQDLLVYLC